jgi:hypothetical protein
MKASISMRAVPAILALLGLAAPMIGSGFIGWTFVVGWLIVLSLLWWIQPLAGADRTTRLGAGVAGIFGLGLLGTVGGFYLVPALLAWLALVLTERSGE